MEPLVSVRRQSISENRVFCISNRCMLGLDDSTGFYANKRFSCRICDSIVFSDTVSVCCCVYTDQESLQES